MTTSDQGILALRWMKRYFSRADARDMERSARRWKRCTFSWSDGRSADRRGSSFGVGGVRIVKNTS